MTTESSDDNKYSNSSHSETQTQQEKWEKNK